MFDSNIDTEYHTPYVWRTYTFTQCLWKASHELQEDDPTIQLLDTLSSNN